MTNPEYDVIVVGARCAGAPLAMLLARQGHRTLLVDRATFPSDTISTHGILSRGRSWLAHERPLSARKAGPMSREGWEAHRALLMLTCPSHLTLTRPFRLILYLPQ